ncbi:hypothetical protein [Lactococcus protaetiae]|uniref:Uncharacterized protein n=1 Tax=Lactococcus protaetiae TaxID=2592653 RepID=A0A514Z815_9LACT|nr:hypothetical protein [Lactococcus protaetiae]QDK70734.1 hypothetical protein FLP15_05670 [Lactococcus protaetiae]
MQFNPLNWNKNQKIIGSVALALILAGGTGLSVSAYQHGEKVKAEQVKVETQKAEALKNEKAKKAEQLAQSEAKKALETTEKTPNEANLKLSETAISKVKDKGVKATFTSQLEGIKTRLKLEASAKTAVEAYKKDATNESKYKTAEQALAKLVSSYSKALKEDLTKQLKASKEQAEQSKQANEAKKQSEQEKQSTLSDTNTAQTGTASAGNSGSTSSNNYSSSTNNSTNTNQGNSSSQNSNNNGSSNNSNGNNTGGNGSSNGNNNGGGQTTQPSQPAPVYKYVGWVSVDGVRRYSQTFNTLREAEAYADSVKDSQEVVDLLLAGHSIRYGVEPVQVN